MPQLERPNGLIGLADKALHAYMGVVESRGSTPKTSKAVHEALHESGLSQAHKTYREWCNGLVPYHKDQLNKIPLVGEHIPDEAVALAIGLWGIATGLMTVFVPEKGLQLQTTEVFNVDWDLGGNQSSTGTPPPTKQFKLPSESEALRNAERWSSETSDQIRTAQEAAKKQKKR